MSLHVRTQTLHINNIPADKLQALQDDAAKFDAAWEMVIEAHQIKGEDISESRLQRTVGGFQRREG